MATYTSNIGLKCPAGDEYVSRFDMNNNYQAIDDAFGAIPSGSNVMAEVGEKLTAPSTPESGKYLSLDENMNPIWVEINVDTASVAETEAMIADYWGGE